MEAKNILIALPSDLSIVVVRSSNPEADEVPKYKICTKTEEVMTELAAGSFDSVLIHLSFGFEFIDGLMLLYPNMLVTAFSEAEIRTYADDSPVKKISEMFVPVVREFPKKLPAELPEKAFSHIPLSSLKKQRVPKVPYVRRRGFY